MPRFTLAGRLERVIDGDSIRFSLRLPFGIALDGTVEDGLSARLYGLNCPEHGTPEGDAATAATAAWLTEHAAHAPAERQKSGHPFDVTSVSWDKYAGRYLALVDCAAGHRLNDSLVQSGHAKTWDGKGPKPV